MRGHKHRYGQHHPVIHPDGHPNVCMLSDDEPATVVRIEGGHQLAARLHNLGILPGKRIKKLGTMPGTGPVMIDCDGVRVALGRRIAAHVLVEPSREADEPKESAQ